MLTKDLSVTFCGVKFPNPFCLSSSPVGNCYEMCAKAYDTGWGGIVFKTIGFFIANEVSPRFDHLTKEDTGFIVFQPLLPPDWKMTLREGSLYAQVAFSAAQGQGFEAGGHGV
ncbi:hypothetical protein MJN52_22070, partial [Salmonella enterica subsp. enterica serovar Kentucky]|nr:hypothetical protein [Salmonella enterica subsp. enterica serovar Kentucky]